jgi:hypothetical protein
MFKPMRGWEAFWEALGRFRRNRRQRRAAAKRRSVVRRHRFDTLEKRVVMNASAINDSDPVELATTYQTAFQFSDLTLLANDSGTGALTISDFSTTTAYGGSVSYAGGVFTYTPANNFYGVDSFEYELTDGDPSTDVAIVSIEVAQNRAPELDDLADVPELNPIDEDDTANAGTLIADLISAAGYATDDDGHPLGIAVTGADTSNGSWQYDTGPSRSLIRRFCWRLMGRRRFASGRTPIMWARASRSTFIFGIGPRAPTAKRLT